MDFSTKHICCINWHILRAIWRLTHNNQDKGKAEFQLTNSNNETITVYKTFNRLLGIDGNIAKNVMIGSGNISKKQIDDLAIRTGIIRAVFEGKQLLINEEEHKDLLFNFAVKRLKGGHPTNYEVESDDIRKILLGYQKELQKENPCVNPEIMKAFYFIKKGGTSDDRQKHIENITSMLDKIQYKSLLKVQKTTLVDYHKALKKQEEYIQSIITFQENM